ncbi:MAG TPA: YbaB/EbfC family nucleoid-associated protein [Dongiaceae bacterium]|jgi:hypothetical protein|nr:YbaB/EbfC family nucleoid-associated protein [Dongiaceae bacterium]
MKNIGNMLRQMGEMQAKMAEMQTMLEAREITGEAGGGTVRVTVNGKGEVRRVRIDPPLLDPQEVGILEDLITAACKDAKGKADRAMQEEMAKLTGGLSLPPGMKLPF